jgi:sugar-specific transcriptional regulator TrmB
MQTFINLRRRHGVMDTAPLRDAGLTDGEIKVYLALLELGSSTTGPIVERSGIAKSIVYQILEKLMRKGVVSVIVQERTKYFQASDPHKLLEYVDERQVALEQNRARIAQLLPQLALKQAMTGQRETRMYVGMRGMVAAHEHIYEKLTKGDEYVYLGIPAFQPEPHHLYWQRDHERRAKAGIRGRLLFNADTDQKIVRQRNTYPGAQARRMREDIQTPAMIMVYKDTVVITVQSPDVVSVEIVHQGVADSFKAYFEEFWKRSEKIGKRRSPTRRRA